MRPQVIGITGSREWNDREAIREALKPYRFGSILVHGGCRGADQIAAHEGSKKGFKLWELPYCEDEDGNECRNESMVAVVAALRSKGHPVAWHAFPLPNSRGTYKCARLVIKAGMGIVGPRGEPLNLQTK